MGVVGTHSESYTDDNGTAAFHAVPVCTVEVHVDGKLRLKVGVGASDHRDVTVTL